MLLRCFGIGCECHFHDFVRVGGRFTALDLVNQFHARCDLAPNSILSVEEAAIRKANKKLRIGGIGVLAAGHAHGAAAEIGF